MDEGKKWLRRADYTRESLLEQWYGRTSGRMEMGVRNPQPLGISEVLDAVVAPLNLEQASRIQSVQQVWPMVADRLGVYSRPVSFRGTALCVEYDSAMILPELIRRKKRFLERLCDALGETVCSDLCFVPKG